MVKIYSIDANIGAGKSMLLHKIKQTLQNSNVVFLQEPVDKWSTFTDKGGESILTKFYRDQQKYSFQFQMMAYISRLASIRQMVRNHPDAIIISERSVFTDRNVFAQMLYDDGKLSEIEFKIYNEWFHEFIRDLPLDGIIFLNVDVNTTYQRIQQRNRTGENEIPIDYLEQCDQYHKKWINNTSTPVLTIEYSEDGFDKLPTIINSIKEFIQ